jgi:hypothetical protein
MIEHLKENFNIPHKILINDVDFLISNGYDSVDAFETLTNEELKKYGFREENFAGGYAQQLSNRSRRTGTDESVVVGGASRTRLGRLGRLREREDEM